VASTVERRGWFAEQCWPGFCFPARPKRQPPTMRKTMKDSAIQQFTKLHTAAIDALNGYKEALDDAEGRGYTSLFRDMISLHQQHADELAKVLVSANQEANEHGSFMSVVHKTIMGVRSLFGGLDASVLRGLVDGEERNVVRYDDALEDSESALLPQHRALLMIQRSNLVNRITQMRADEEQSKGDRMGDLGTREQSL
jgi:uncharacterized protein (TIGR02284 family)